VAASRRSAMVFSFSMLFLSEVLGAREQGNS
jgi:hypothetical protein